MRYWDSSALVPLLVQKPHTGDVLALYRHDHDVITWWGSEIECASAVARLERSRALGADGVGRALARLDDLRRTWREAQPVADVKIAARRFLRVHPLRAADALQLGAASSCRSAGRRRSSSCASTNA